MSRKLKTLVIALLTLVVITAIACSSAPEGLPTQPTAQPTVGTSGTGGSSNGGSGSSEVTETSVPAVPTPEVVLGGTGGSGGTGSLPISPATPTPPAPAATATSEPEPEPTTAPVQPTATTPPAPAPTATPEPEIREVTVDTCDENAIAPLLNQGREGGFRVITVDGVDHELVVEVLPVRGEDYDFLFQVGWNEQSGLVAGSRLLFEGCSLVGEVTYLFGTGRNLTPVGTGQLSLSYDGSPIVDKINTDGTTTGSRQYPADAGFSGNVTDYPSPDGQGGFTFSNVEVEIR